MSPTLETLFAHSEPEGECLIWRGLFNNGAPQVYVGGGGGQRKYRMVRRLVYSLTHGRPIRNGYIPVMTCRDPRCIAIEHFSILTPRAYGALLSKEGVFSSPSRQAAITRGIREKRVLKLDLEKARAIRESTEPQYVKAERYGVHKSMIGRVERGEVWRETAAAASVFSWRGA